MRDTVNEQLPKVDESDFLVQCDLTGLDFLSSTIVEKLKAGPSPFILWLVAPMGAGKTTLSSKILNCLGLDSFHPVLSPTYTYINEYKIGSNYYAHLDLYRLSSTLTLEDLGIDYNSYSGFIIEWPNSSLKLLDLDPTHILFIKYTDKENERRFYLRTCI